MEDLIETAPCGFLTILDDGTIARANATLARLLGYADGELVGLTVDRILPVPSRIFYQTHLFPLLKLRGRADEVYLALRCNDGSSLPMLTNAVRRERDGRTVIDFVLLQMKERGQYEDAIIAAKRQAEDASRTKDQFLAAVSHELRTPLHSVLGWVHLLRGGQKDPETTAKGLNAIERGANSLKTLIEDIIDFSRIDSGKMRLSVDRVEVSEVIDSALDIVRPAADAKSIVVERNAFPESAPVSGDPERLQQVLWNLLANAIKFTPKGGRVSVRLGRVNSSVEIAVSDTGKGIRSEFLPFVFERFRQASNEASSRSDGLGLGMAITRHLVELHGGTIRAESPGEGSGSTFTVRLPLMSVERPEALRTPALLGYEERPQPGELGGLEGLWVLVVENDAQSRTMLTNVLENVGAQVIVAAGMQEALEQFRKYRPHLVLSDIEMPDGDGYSLIGAIRQIENGGPPAPAIALTALARPADRVRALAAGFNMHIAKPVDPVELVLAISGLTGQTHLHAGAA